MDKAKIDDPSANMKADSERQDWQGLESELG